MASTQITASGDDRRPAALAPGHTYASVTKKISALVLVRPYNWRWLLGMAVGFVLTMMLFVAVTYLLLMRGWHLGHQCPGDVGLRDRQLRLVDRHRPCGNFDFGHPACCSSRTGGRRSTALPRR